SEYRYREIPCGPATLGIAVSQSGETADTLAGLEILKQRGGRTLAVCNVVGSSLARLAGRVSFLHARPELRVASTKAFTTQVLALLNLALELGRLRGICTEALRQEILGALSEVPDQLARALPGMDQAAAPLGATLAGARFVPYIGRGTGFALALE